MEMILNIQDILKILPHKYPFLMVDGVLDLDPGKYIRAVKNVSINEPCFGGHFPDNPILPGVLIVEALAQTTALLYCYEAYKANQENSIDQNVQSKVGYLATISEMKFKRLVRPGDQLFLHAETMESFGKFMEIKVWAQTDKKVAQGKLIVTHS